MHGGRLFIGLVTAYAMFALAARAQEMEPVPSRLSAFLPRSSLPPDSKQMASDEHYSGCRGLPGTCHGRCEGDQFCRTLVSSDGKRYCGCSASPP
jgi:hypothetical protein